MYYSNLFGYELVGSFPNLIVYISGSLKDGPQCGPRCSYAFDNGSTNQGRRVNLKVSQIQTNDGTIRVTGVLKKKCQEKSVLVMGERKTRWLCFV